MSVCFLFFSCNEGVGLLLMDPATPPPVIVCPVSWKSQYVWVHSACLPCVWWSPVIRPTRYWGAGLGETSISSSVGLSTAHDSCNKQPRPALSDAGNVERNVFQRRSNAANTLRALAPCCHGLNGSTWNALFTVEESVTHIVCFSSTSTVVSLLCSAVRTSLSAISPSIAAGLVHWFTCSAQSRAVVVFTGGTTVWF